MAAATAPAPSAAGLPSLPPTGLLPLVRRDLSSDERAATVTRVATVRGQSQGLLASMMEHSCEPNCIISIGNAEDGSVLTLTTKRDVVPGEALTISYVPLGRSVSERRGLLSSQHGFLCECRRCTVEFAVEALKGDEV